MGKRLFEEVGRRLQAQGLKVSTGTIVDASIICALYSTKNQEGKCDPGMCQTKKGNQWYFRMKAHIGVDSKTKLIHSVVATAANVHVQHPVPQLLHGGERRVYGGSAYAGQRDVIGQTASKAKNFTQLVASWHNQLTERDREKNRTKSQLRAKVEHAFMVIKRVFGFARIELSRIEEKRQPPVRGYLIGQPLHGAPAYVQTSGGKGRPMNPHGPRRAGMLHHLRNASPSFLHQRQKMR